MGVHAFLSIFQRFVLHQIFGSAASLILGQRDGYDLCLFSSPQPHNPYESSSSSSLIVTADFLMKLPKHLLSSYERHAFGLFLLRVYYEKMVICNPSTGQLALLPDEEELISSTIYLLFDPVDKQVKVLSLKSYKLSLILTLGTGDDLWREIYCPLNNLSTSEIFKFIYKDFFERERKTYREFIRDRDRTKMINYKGKLGVITLKYDYNPWDWDPNNSKDRSCQGIIKFPILYIINHINDSL
ncbi:hypothetical protein F2Q70_00030170 [Brassica cretica]|uniref:F-box associated beta-propeller type 3 domain-containing protein n=1 Tax=Brassica cretica TaxID=69181 RepID=A0A8S9FJT3_BRACR|nr:hypothetical protein F2Q70_00030170 [Brassica cretica]